MDLPVLIGQLIGTPIGAAIGAYIAGRWTESGRISAVTAALRQVVEQETAKAFAQEQGKQQAMMANLEHLDTQMRTLTTTQEQIKSQISGELWNRQMNWTQKRALYIEMVRKLRELLEIYGRLRVFLRKGMGESIEQTLAEVYAGEGEFNQLWTLARIFGNAECNTAVSTYVARENPLGKPTEQWAEAEAEAITALMVRIIAAAKADLGVVEA